MPLSRATLLLRAMGNLLLGRRPAADRLFSQVLRQWPGDACALAGRAHLRAEVCRQVEALAEARWQASHPAEHELAALCRFDRAPQPPAAPPRAPSGAPRQHETGLVR